MSSFDLSTLPGTTRQLADVYVELARKKLRKSSSVVFSSSNDIDEDLYKDNLLSLNVSIKISSELATFDFTTNEGYTMTIKNVDGAVTVKINSQTIFGARHALETLYQLTASLPNSAHR